MLHNCYELVIFKAVVIVVWSTVNGGSKLVKPQNLKIDTLVVKNQSQAWKWVTGTSLCRLVKVTGSMIFWFFDHSIFTVVLFCHFNSVIVSTSPIWFRELGKKIRLRLLSGHFSMTCLLCVICYQIITLFYLKV